MSYAPTAVGGSGRSGRHRRPRRGPPDAPGVRLSVLPHGRGPGRLVGHADPGYRGRGGGQHLLRRALREQHFDLPRRRAVLDVLPPVAVRGPGRPDRGRRRGDRLRRGHRLGYRAAPALRNTCGRRGVQPDGLVRREQGSRPMLIEDVIEIVERPRTSGCRT